MLVLQSQGRAAHMAAAGRVKLKAPHAPILPRTNCCEILLVGHSQEERFVNKIWVLGQTTVLTPPRGKRSYMDLPTIYGQFLVVLPSAMSYMAHVHTILAVRLDRETSRLASSRPAVL